MLCAPCFLAFRPRAVFVPFLISSTVNDSITAPPGAVTSLGHNITVVLSIVIGYLSQMMAVSMCGGVEGLTVGAIFVNFGGLDRNFP